MSIRKDGFDIAWGTESKRICEVCGKEYWGFMRAKYCLKCRQIVKNVTSKERWQREKSLKVK